MNKMIKMFYVLLVICTMYTHVNASEYDVFIGAEAGLSWADFDGPNGEYQNHEIDTYGAKAGVVSDRTRIYLSYQYMDAFKDSTTRDGEYQTLTANTEAFTDPLHLFNFLDLVFFVGGHLGAVNINVEASFGESDEYALLYGVQAGILARFNQLVSLEAGYRFSYSDFSDQNTDLDKIQVAYGGINLRF